MLRTKTLLALLAGILAIAPIQAQTFTTITSFDGAHGGNPYKNMSLVQGLDGNLYGVTLYGGASSDGVVFRLIGGALTTLHTFSGTDGRNPVGSLVLATNGKFYGTTELGGNHGGNYCALCGAIFKITPTGAFATIYTFCSLTNCTDGESPLAPLILGTTGSFYGAAEVGGTGCGGCGTAFKISGAGALKTLHNFTGQNGTGDGYVPTAPLVQASDGNFYGTTYDGGGASCNCGSVFKMTPAGAVKILYSFGSSGNYSQGAFPYAGLVEGLDGNLYGATTGGGSPNGGEGTIFKIAKDGTLTKLHTFSGNPDGIAPSSNLVLGSDGNLYGTTPNGGTIGGGTIFRIAPDGTHYRVLQNFTGKKDGALPFGGLVQVTDGNFYGTTKAYGSNTDPSCQYITGFSCGTIFRFSVGLGPFIKTLPTSGAAGNAVKILGSSLSGATAVIFNGTPAAITCNTATEICTKVPAGATTGRVTVTTPSGILMSSIPFRVP